MSPFGNIRKYTISFTNPNPSLYVNSMQMIHSYTSPWILDFLTAPIGLIEDINGETEHFFIVLYFCLLEAILPAI